MIRVEATPEFVEGDQRSASGDDTTTTTVNATMEPDCAPDDGPAFSITILETDMSCGLDLATTPSVSFYVYDVFPVAVPQTIDLSASGTGLASSCEGLASPVPCAETTNASITFETYEEGARASGTWTADFGQGQVSGTFEAVYCEPPTGFGCG